MLSSLERWSELSLVCTGEPIIYIHNGKNRSPHVHSLCIVSTGFFGSKSSKSTKDLTTLSTAREYPTDVEAYELLEDCGRGVSATVYRSLCKPFNEIVAVGF